MNENLYNSAHKTTSESFRQGYDNIKWYSQIQEGDPMSKWKVAKHCDFDREYLDALILGEIYWRDNYEWFLCIEGINEMAGIEATLEAAMQACDEAFRRFQKSVGEVVI